MQNQGDLKKRSKQSAWTGTNKFINEFVSTFSFASSKNS